MVERESLAALVLLSLAAMAAAFIAFTPVPMTSTTTLVIALDRSASLSAADGCSALDRLLQQAATPASRLQVVVLALSKRGITRLGSLQLAPTGRVLDGKAKAATSLASDIEQLVAACRGLEESPNSPIFTLVERALAYVPASACNDGNVCRLVVRTDGREGVDRRLKRALRQRTAKRRSSDSKSEPRLKNENIAITLCGLGEGRALRGPSLARVAEVWRAEFTAPDLVTVSAGCAAFRATTNVEAHR